MCPWARGFCPHGRPAGQNLWVLVFAGGYMFNSPSSSLRRRRTINAPSRITHHLGGCTLAQGSGTVRHERGARAPAQQPNGTPNGHWAMARCADASSHVETSSHRSLHHFTAPRSVPRRPAPQEARGLRKGLPPTPQHLRGSPPAGDMRCRRRERQMCWTTRPRSSVLLRLHTTSHGHENPRLIVHREFTPVTNLGTIDEPPKCDARSRRSGAWLCLPICKHTSYSLTGKRPSQQPGRGAQAR